MNVSVIQRLTLSFGWILYDNAESGSSTQWLLHLKMRTAEVPLKRRTEIKSDTCERNSQEKKNKQTNQNKTKLKTHFN